MFLKCLQINNLDTKIVMRYMNMDNSKITSLNDKHFLSVDEQIRLLQNRGFKISNKVFF